MKPHITHVRFSSEELAYIITGAMRIGIPLPRNINDCIRVATITGTSNMLGGANYIHNPPTQEAYAHLEKITSGAYKQDRDTILQACHKPKSELLEELTLLNINHVLPAIPSDAHKTAIRVWDLLINGHVSIQDLLSQSNPSRKIIAIILNEIAYSLVPDDIKDLINNLLNEEE